MTWNIGHRGAAGLEPENTVRSFRRAEGEGTDALELDLRITRDGHLFVIHDPTVNRTTDGPVHELALSELQQLDGGMGERVPTCGEVLEATTLPKHAELKVVEVVHPLVRLIFEKRAVIEAGKRPWVQGTGASRYCRARPRENGDAYDRSDLLHQPRIGRWAWDHLPSASGVQAGMYRGYDVTGVYAAGAKVRRAVEMASFENHPRRGERC